MNNMLVLDWDGVIFNDDLYKTNMFTCLQKFGLAPSDAQRLYQESKDHNGFNDRRLAQSVADYTGNTLTDVLQALDEVISKTEAELLYSDAYTTIIEASQRYNIVVLTAGDDRIQRMKIRASGLSAYLHDIIIVPVVDTESNKSNELKKLYKKHGSLIFYDDRISTILHLHEVFRDEPAFLPIFVCRTLRSRTDASNVLAVGALSTASLQLHGSLLSTPRTLIAATRIEHDDTLLLVQERHGRAKGLWSIPIGHVEHDQTFLEAAAREANEETGSTISITGFRSILGVKGTEYLGSDFDLTRLIIIVCFDATVLSQDGEAELTSRWTSREERKVLPLRGEWQPLLWD